MKFEIRDSPINSKGLFATGTIKKGEVVTVWHPKVMTKQEAAKLSADEQKHYTYPEDDHILWMQPPERYMNHSCEANTHVERRCDVATRDIAVGEEITSDYLDIETEDFVCNCGSVNCRGRKGSSLLW